MTIRTSRTIALRLATALMTAPIVVPALLVPTVSAAWIVYDPTNYGQNVLQAARALEQINNQITSLQNEAQMLINQARNLTSLPHSSLQQLQQSLQQTQQLLSEAQNIAFDVNAIDDAFTSRYGDIEISATDAELITEARTRWENTVAGLQDAMRVQAGVVSNIDRNRSEMSSLVGQSQSATGALQATQAGNQISQQLSDLIAMLSANGRSTALSEAERATAAEQGRVQRQRFLAPGSGYQQGNARMFNN
ncbi:P-type conjugative transfer protein TrbJ [uncultured Cohaesibacter sp.]|uniref:P-type conjugative transfer protein TrbJ n=1 Tax=uncultured Cohaesibacter sp. TaxID=1002546 RepID=UPI0029C8842C|nr:P-type conjugative transfer protein TrbJ [uncultured Cohaesibacter sp.]